MPYFGDTSIHLIDLEIVRFPKLNHGFGGMGDTTWQEKAVMAGRLVCDTYHLAKEFIRHKNYR